MSAHDELREAERKAREGEELSYQERLLLNARVDELNALSLAEALGALRSEYDEKFRAQENELTAMKTNLANMQQFIAQTLGSTINDNGTNERQSDMIERLRRSLRRHLRQALENNANEQLRSAWRADLQNQLRMLDE